MFSPDLIKLFRSSLFYFHPVESGGGGLYPMSPLGGHGLILDRVADVLGRPRTDAPQELEALARIYVEYLLTLPQIIKQVELPTGKYEVVDLGYAFQEITKGLDINDPASNEIANQRAVPAFKSSFADYKQSFEVTPTLLAMAKLGSFQIEMQYQVLRIYSKEDEEKMLVEYPKWFVEMHPQMKQFPPDQLFESPICVVDGKRPYGERTFYYWDLEDAKVPGIAADDVIREKFDRKHFSAAAQKRIDALQKQTPLVFQAMAQYGKL